MASMSGDENPIKETGKYNEWKMQFCAFNSLNKHISYDYIAQNYIWYNRKTGENKNVVRQWFIDCILRFSTKCARQLTNGRCVRH